MFFRAGARDVGGASRWVLGEASNGSPLDRAVRSVGGGESWNKVRRLIETGKIRVDGQTVTDPRAVVRAGQTIELVLNAPRATRAPKLAATIVYVDPHVVVVHKPPGISTVPFDETERDTLDHRTAEALLRKEGVRRPPLGIVQRLDKETTGLVVFARTVIAKRELKNQFRFHTVERRYWAVAHGAVRSQTLSSRLVRDRGDGMRGSTENPKLGREATTHVRVIQRFALATLVECQLETGRTHQIRIHLAEAGHPLVGERLYSRNYRGALLPAPRILLHAFELGFSHPVTRAPLHFESPMPEDMRQFLRELEPLPGAPRSR